MTDNLPAVPDPATSREVARQDTDSWIDVLADVGRLAEAICGTEFVPTNLRNSKAATAAAIMYGREVGLPPMTALTQTHVIEGKPAMSAEGMRALILAAGHELTVIETTGALCRMKARRRGTEDWTELTWTIDMARAAGVAGKKVWQSYPRQMLQARCTTELARLVFPDVIHGFRSVEELDDGDDVASEVGPAPVETTKVARKRTTAKRSAAALPAAPAPTERPEQPAGPPLPGELGYEDDSAPAAAPEQAGEVGSDDGDASSHGESTGNHGEDPASPANETDGAGGEPEGEAGDPPAPEEPTDEPEVEAETKPRDGGRKATRAQHRMIFASLGGLYPGEEVPDEERLLVASTIVGRPIESFNDLLHHDAQAIIDTLARVKDRAALMNLLDTIDESRTAEQAAADGEDQS